MNKREWSYWVIGIGIFAVVAFVVGGRTFPLTEGAELELDPSVKVAPFMDIETGLYGYIDIKGQTIIEPRYQYAESFSEGVAVVAESGSKGTYYGYINKKGDTVLALKYDYARGFHEGLALVSLDGNLIVINKGGDALFRLPAEMVAGDYASGLAPLYAINERSNNAFAKSGYIDRNGDIVFEKPMIKGMTFSEGYAQILVRRDKERLWGYIDEDGNTMIAPRFASSEPFSEGVAAVAVRDDQGHKKWGYIDTTGTFVIDPIYDSAFAFSENLAVVYLDNKGYAYIDRTGRIVIGPNFEMATSFCGGYANIRTSDTEFSCINKTGEKLFTVENKLIFDFK